MPDGLAAALATPGLAALLALTVVVGLIYGYAGFGAGLIFVPVASVLIEPAQAVLSLSLFGVGSVLTVLPRAWAQAERSAALTMLAAALVALPLGTWALAATPEEPLRWAMSAIVGTTLVALVAGWRWRGEAGLGARLAVGAGSGALGGATGLVGPIVILFQLGRGQPAAVTRANTIVFLTLLSAALLPGLALGGLVNASALWLSLVLLPAYMAATCAGQASFRPEHEALYQRAAHAVIALAVLAGLPVWR